MADWRLNVGEVSPFFALWAATHATAFSLG
jgi:hypothetical protein